MKYQVTPKMQSVLNGITDLIRETQSWLHLVSPAARDEWLRRRDGLAEAADDLRCGLLSLSEREIEDVYSKFKRFRQIVSGAHPELRTAGAVSGADLLPPPDAHAGWSAVARTAQA